MNRTLLILVCDFLLVSMLAIIEIDPPKAEPPAEVRAEPTVEQAQAEALASLKESLDGERQDRALLQQALEFAQKTTEEQTTILQSKVEEQAQAAAEARRLAEARAAELAERQREIAEQETQLLRTRESLAQTERDAALERERLAAEIAQKEAEARRIAAEGSTQVALTQAELARMEKEKEIALAQAAEIRAQYERQLRETETARQQAIAAAERATQIEREKAEVAAQLRETAVKVEQAEVRLVEAQARVEVERTERERIQAVAEAQAAESTRAVSQLAESTAALRQEIRQDKEMASTEIFSRYLSHRSEIVFEGVTTAATGGRALQFRVPAILVTDGTLVFAVFQAADSPFPVGQSQRSFASLNAAVTVAGRLVQAPENALLFHSADPRLAAIRVDAPWPSLGLEPFPVADNPARWDSAIVIRPGDSAYGPAPVKLDAAKPGYLVRDYSPLRSLAGEFKPASKDWVFARSGAFTGAFVDNENAATVTALQFADAIPLGSSFQAVLAEQATSRAAARLRRLPGAAP